jgi:hypothetical protein
MLCAHSLSVRSVPSVNVNKPHEWHEQGQAAMQIDWSGIRAAAIAGNNIREAARSAASDLQPVEQARFVQRVLKRAQREQWLARARAVSEAAKPINELPSSSIVANGSDSLAKTLSRRKDKSAMHLSRYVVDASRRAAASKGELKLAQDVRHVAGVRSHLWPEDSSRDSVDVQILSIGGSVNLSAK